MSKTFADVFSNKIVITELAKAFRFTEEVKIKYTLPGDNKKHNVVLVVKEDKKAISPKYAVMLACKLSSVLSCAVQVVVYDHASESERVDLDRTSAHIDNKQAFKEIIFRMAQQKPDDQPISEFDLKSINLDEFECSALEEKDKPLHEIALESIDKYLSQVKLESFNNFSSSLSEIKDYQPVFIPCFTKNAELRIAYRSYICQGESFYVTVDPYSLKTECRPINNYSSRRIGSAAKSLPGYFTKQEIDSTPYVQSLVEYTSPPYKLQNYGATESKYPVDGIMLTVDLCPSSKPFEADFFLKLASCSQGTPTAVSISISGLWLIHHSYEFNWLISQQGKTLDITWINHSFSHVYYPDKSKELDTNFLLDERTNLDYEILEPERLLIRHNQSPSVFFRAPGLVTNETLVKKLNKFGLIPIGSDAWLAKGQTVKKGSFVLVHGNSNEPAGIEQIMPFLDQMKFRLFPLARAFISEKEQKEKNSMLTLNLSS